MAWALGGALNPELGGLSAEFKWFELSQAVQRQRRRIACTRKGRVQGIADVMICEARYAGITLFQRE